VCVCVVGWLGGAGRGGMSRQLLTSCQSLSASASGSHGGICWSKPLLLGLDFQTLATKGCRTTYVHGYVSVYTHVPTYIHMYLAPGYEFFSKFAWAGGVNPTSYQSRSLAIRPKKTLANLPHFVCTSGKICMYALVRCDVMRLLARPAKALDFVTVVKGSRVPKYPTLEHAPIWSKYILLKLKKWTYDVPTYVSRYATSFKQTCPVIIPQKCSSWQPSTCGRRSDWGWNCKPHK
jgi:hypothetical protein